jgi:hypothetical protein
MQVRASAVPEGHPVTRGKGRKVHLLVWTGRKYRLGCWTSGYDYRTSVTTLIDHVTCKRCRRAMGEGRKHGKA